MLSRASRLRLRRRLRLQKRQVGELSSQAEFGLERNFFRRLERLASVRRFVISWSLLIVLLVGIVVVQTRALSNYYQVPTPVSGGTYREGVLGRFTNANPIYATGLADSSVARLVFSGLLTYDSNNKLVGDLAESWEADETGQTYTVHLKSGLTWHDGETLSAKDVEFTYQVIKSPDAQSPLNTTWQDVKVTATDDRTVVFELPDPLASFPYSLTTGIIPEHILGDVSMADMRSALFNTAQPIGSGPFKWQAIEVEGSDLDSRTERIALRAFEDYHAGSPKINSFIIQTFRSEEQLIQSFNNQEISAISGLDSMPEELQQNPNIYQHNMLLTAQVMTFFRTNNEILGDADVRRALVRAADTTQVMRELSYPTIAVREPLLSGQLGFDNKDKQPGHDLADARKILNERGWKLGDDGIRRKKGQALTFTLHTQDNEDYVKVANLLRRQWRAAGVDVQIIAEGENELQNTLAYHSYDALLYGIAIGQDPDVFAYWHSSQNDERLTSRLNFSEYSSAKADAALEDARTRLDPELRDAKLQPFLQAWRTDAPALGLYQPRFLYVTRGEVHGLTTSEINSDSQRFADVHNWMIRERRQTPERD